MTTKQSPLKSLVRLEKSLANDRDALNRLLRVIRTLITHLKYGEEELRKAQGTKAFKIIKNSYDAQIAMAEEFLEQLEAPTDDEVTALAVPSQEQESIVDESPSEGVILPEEKPKQLQRISPVSKHIIEAAFTQEVLPTNWDDLMRIAYGPQWSALSLASLPGRWGMKDETLADEIYATPSSIRRSVLRSAHMILLLRAGEELRVTADISHLVTLSFKYPDFEKQVAHWQSPIS